MSNFRWEGTEISPSLFLIYGRQTVPAKMHGGCHCCHSETVSFVVSILSRDVPCECSISECLAIVPLTRHQFRTKSGQFNGCLHACLHENILASENPEKRRAYSSAFSSKMWYSRVICVFLRWGLTYIWHVLWGKLSFKYSLDSQWLMKKPSSIIQPEVDRVLLLSLKSYIVVSSPPNYALCSSPRMNSPTCHCQAILVYKCQNMRSNSSVFPTPPPNWHSTLILCQTNESWPLTWKATLSLSLFLAESKHRCPGWLRVASHNQETDCTAGFIKLTNTKRNATCHWHHTNQWQEHLDGFSE